MRQPSIGVVAPSSAVPQVELKLGAERLRQSGFSVTVHPQCRRRELFFAGSDEERARAFFEIASDDRHDVLWCARGGYGAMRILPLLDRLAAERGRPRRKLLVGYSDATALVEYVRARWGWATLHAPMPGLRDFAALTGREWAAVTGAVRGEAASVGAARLKFLGAAPGAPIEGELAGGNLSVWTSLLGTAHPPGPLDGKILFLEEVAEPFYRIDRMFQQLLQSGALAGARAIVLGTFDQCTDPIPRVLKKEPAAARLRAALRAPKPAELKPLRPKVPLQRALQAIFVAGVPVAFGLRTGHGNGHLPLPLGARYRLAPDGRFELLAWDWRVDTESGLR